MVFGLQHVKWLNCFVAFSHLCPGGVEKAGRRNRSKAIPPTATLWESVQSSSIVRMFLLFILRAGPKCLGDPKRSTFFYIRSFGVERAIDVGWPHTSFQILPSVNVQSNNHIKLTLFTINYILFFCWHNGSDLNLWPWPKWCIFDEPFTNPGPMWPHVDLEKNHKWWCNFGLKSGS